MVSVYSSRAPVAAAMAASEATDTTALLMLPDLAAGVPAGVAAGVAAGDGDGPTRPRQLPAVTFISMLHVASGISLLMVPINVPLASVRVMFPPMPPPTPPNGKVTMAVFVPLITVGTALPPAWTHAESKVEVKFPSVADIIMTDFTQSPALGTMQSAGVVAPVAASVHTAAAVASRAPRARAAAARMDAKIFMLTRKRNE